MSEEHKKKLALSHIGLRPSKETLFRLKLVHKGIHYSPKTEFKKGIYQGYGFRKGHHPWNYGSKNFEPYGRGWTNILRESIRLRDNYKCQICKMPQEECYEALHIHHINGIKQNLNPNNLISLCRSCHTKENNKQFKKKLAIEDQ